MDITLIECPGGRIVLLCGRSLVYSEGPDCRHPHYDAEYMAEALARATVGGRVHRVDLPRDFAVRDEDGPLPGITPEHVRDWWVATCDAQAEEAAMADPPPAYPTLAEQVLGVIGHAGLEITDEVRRLASELDRVAWLAEQASADRRTAEMTP